MQQKTDGRVVHHAPLELIDVFASTLPSLSFGPRPARQLCRDSTSMRDGLPKFKDFPAEIGGSGEQMPE